MTVTCQMFPPTKCVFTSKPTKHVNKPKHHKIRTKRTGFEVFHRKMLYSQVAVARLYSHHSFLLDLICIRISSAQCKASIDCGLNVLRNCRLPSCIILLQRTRAHENDVVAVRRFRHVPANQLHHSSQSIPSDGTSVSPYFHQVFHIITINQDRTNPLTIHNLSPFRDLTCFIIGCYGMCNFLLTLVEFLQQTEQS